MSNSVIFWRVRSHTTEKFQLTFRVEMTSARSEASKVFDWSVPAFCHWVLKPKNPGSGARRIWS